MTCLKPNSGITTSRSTRLTSEKDTVPATRAYRQGPNTPKTKITRNIKVGDGQGETTQVGEKERGEKNAKERPGKAYTGSGERHGNSPSTIAFRRSSERHKKGFEGKSQKNSSTKKESVKGNEVHSGNRR